MIISVGILITVLTSSIQCQMCDLTTRCGHLSNNVPKCEELKDNRLYECLVDLLQDCHNAPDETTLELKNMKLARDVFCKDKTLAASFKDNIQCWSSMKTCIANFGEARMQIEQNATNKQIICKEVKTTRDICLSHASDQCRDIETTFINIAHDQIICEPESATPERPNNAMNHVQKLTTSIILLLFVYIM